MLKTFGRSRPEVWFNKPDPDDDLVVHWSDEDGSIFEDQDDPEIEDADGRVKETSVLPDEEDDERIVFADDDEDDDIVLLADDEDDEEEKKSDDEDDEFEELDVDVDTDLQSTIAEQNQQQAINQAQAEAVWARAQADAQVAQSQLQQAQLGFTALDEKEQKLVHEMQRAQEDDDAVLAMQINTQLQSINNIRSELEAGVSQINNPDAILQHGRQQAQQLMSRQPMGKRVGASINTNHPMADRWAKANASWMGTNERANQFVIAQSQQMVQSGQWDPNTPGFYAEVAKRVKASYPGLQVKTISAKGGAKKKANGRGRAKMAATPARTRSATPSRNRSSNNTSKKTVSLGKVDLAAMRRANLDPGNSKHRAAFAKSRIQTSRQGA